MKFIFVLFPEKMQKKIPAFCISICYEKICRIYRNDPNKKNVFHNIFQQLDC